MRPRLSAYILFFCFVFMLPIFGYAQVFKAEHYDQEMGLASQYVFDINQDEEGVMWFLTLSGISQYNGSSWRTIETLTGDVAVPNSKYSRFFRTSEGMHVLGLNRENQFIYATYTESTWKVRNLPLVVEGNRFSIDIKAHEEAAKNELMIGYASTLAYSNDNGQSWSITSIPSTRETINNVQFFDGQRLVFTGTTIYKFDGVNFQRYELEGVTQDLIRQLGGVSALEGVGKDSLFIFGKNGLALQHADNVGLELEVKDPIGNAYSHAQMYMGGYFKHGVVLVNSRLYLCHEDGSYQPLVTYGVDAGSRINRFFVDRQQNLWWGSDRGMHKFNSLMLSLYDINTGLIYNEISAVDSLADGSILLGSNIGWQIYKDGVFQKPVLFPEDLTNNRVLQSQLYKGETYLTVHTLGLFKLNRDQKSYEVIFDEHVYATAVDDDTFYFLALGNIPYEMDANGQIKPLGKRSSPTQYIRKLIPHPKWGLIGVGQLGISDILNDTWLYGYQSNLDPSTANIYDLTFLDEDRAIIATVDGLREYDFKTNQSKPYLIDDTPINHPVYAISTFEDSSLWLGTDRGVYRYDKQRGLNHFSRREGLIGNEVNRSALFRDASGKVWIGNERGLAIYHPELHRDKPLPPQVRITQTENLTQNTRFEKQNLVEVDAKSTVAISFSVASYFDEEHVQIRYRLLPQMDWIYEEGQQNRTKYFHALSKGQYRFELQARDSNSDWSASSFSPLINVKPPFYQAPWFYVLLLSVLALAGYILWRLYYLRQQEVKLNQEVEIRTRKLKESQLKLQQQNKELLQINKSLDHFTSAVSHDIKSPLNSSIGLLDLLDDSYNKEELLHFIGMVTGNLKKLRVFVQELIEISRNANQSVRSEAVDLAGLITDIFAINDTDDYSKRVDKRLVIQDHVPFYGDPSRMNVIFSNLISNAVKYQNTKEEHPFCDVRIDVLEDEAIITVKDNGRGIPKKHQEQIFEMFYRADTSVNGTGLGLFLVKEVVDKLGGSIKLNSDESSGSAFYITLPNSYSACRKKRGDEASRTTSPSDSAKHSGNQDEKLPSKN